MTNALTGEQLRAIRRELGLTQEEAAHLIGCTVGSWNRWEKGEHRPSRLALQAIARLCAQRGVSITLTELSDGTYGIEKAA